MDYDTELERMYHPENFSDRVEDLSERFGTVTEKTRVKGCLIDALSAYPEESSLEFRQGWIEALAHLNQLI